MLRYEVIQIEPFPIIDIIHTDENVEMPPFPIHQILRSIFRDEEDYKGIFYDEDFEGG